MKFRNPVNGHIVDKQYPWFGALMFGGLYLLASGLWAAFLIWLVIAVLLFASMGAPAVVLMLIVNAVYACIVGSLIRDSYLAKGWTEVVEPEGPLYDEAGAKVAADPLPDVRACPFCAEEIKAAAIKCKHCGSGVEPLVAVPAVFHTRAAS